MKTDSRIGGGASAHVYRHALTSSISLFLQCLAGVVDPKAKRRVQWTPLAASTAAVLMALDADTALTGRFPHVRSCLKRNCRGRRRTGKSYNGWIKALERQSDVSLPLVKTELRGHVRKRLTRIDPTSPWLLLAVDGSKEELPRTADHEKGFGIADNGIYPQAFVTTVVEVHTGLPWDWRIGEARSSEREHLSQMIGDLPADTLLLADAYYIGFPIWSQLCAKEQPFLIRVGGNVRLITGLWPHAQITRQRDIVYVWPKKARKTRAPLKLRLIKVGSGDKAVYLLTNVLDSKRLSKQAAGHIYRLRWSVELFYRTLKRTLGCAKLRSKAARRARIELEWTLVALTIVMLLGIDAAVKRRRDPRKLSPAQLIRTMRVALRSETAYGPRARSALNRALGNCLRDAYQRKASKQSRHRIVTSNTPKTKINPPIVQKATKNEQQEARKYHQSVAA